MNYLKNIIKDKMILNILLLIFGLILLIFPIKSLSLAAKVIAVILMIVGLTNIIYYFIDNKLKTRVDSLYLLLSIIILGVGIYTFIKPLWLTTTINILVGILLIIGSINNLRYLFKHTTKNNIWYTYFIITIVFLIIGIISFIKPLQITKLIVSLKGLSLIIEAVMTLIINKKYEVKLLKEKE